jgi:hypothetical protein
VLKCYKSWNEIAGSWKTCYRYHYSPVPGKYGLFGTEASDSFHAYTNKKPWIHKIKYHSWKLDTNEKNIYLKSFVSKKWPTGRLPEPPDSNIWSWVLWDSKLRITVLARGEGQQKISCQSGLVSGNNFLDWTMSGKWWVSAGWVGVSESDSQQSCSPVEGEWPVVIRPLLSSKRKERKYGHGSQWGPKPRMPVLARISSNLLDWTRLEWLN